MTGTHFVDSYWHDGSETGTVNLKVLFPPKLKQPTSFLPQFNYRLRDKQKPESSATVVEPRRTRIDNPFEVKVRLH